MKKTRITEQVIAKISGYWEAGPGSNAPEFSAEEDGELNRLIAGGYLNADAFSPVALRGRTTHYVRYGPYPFTKKALDEEAQNWYMRFRQGSAVAIVRDVLTTVAFIVSLILALKQLFHW